jgi:hypothetical protein
MQAQKVLAGDGWLGWQKPKRAVTHHSDASQTGQPMF